MIKYFIPVVLAILVMHCTKNSTDVSTTFYNNVLLEGVVYKNAEEGESLSVNTLVNLVSNKDTLTSITDAKGKFNFRIPDTTTVLSLIIDEPGYFKLDTLVTKIDTTLFTFHIQEIIYYFPTEIGKTYKYDALYSFQGGPHITRYAGIESWTITSFSDSVLSGTICCFLNGNHYDLWWSEGGSQFDTTSIKQMICRKEYIFHFTNGSIYVENNISDSCETVFDQFLKYGKRFQFAFPPNTPDIIPINIYGQGGYRREYEMQRNVGMTKYEESQDAAFGGYYIKYELLPVNTGIPPHGAK